MRFITLVTVIVCLIHLNTKQMVQIKIWRYFSLALRQGQLICFKIYSPYAGNKRWQKNITRKKKSRYLRKSVGIAHTPYLINSSFSPDLFPRKGSEIHKWLSLNGSNEKSYITNQVTTENGGQNRNSQRRHLRNKEYAVEHPRDSKKSLYLSTSNLLLLFN